MSATHQPLSASPSPSVADSPPHLDPASAAAPARLDPFTPIHKGLRRALFETALALARTDFESRDELAAAQRATTTCFDYLREHAEHEDRHVIPRLAELDAGLAGTLEVDHPRLERAALAVDDLWPRVLAAPDGARTAVGRELVRRFNDFVARQLQHMDREEREVTAALWASMTDAQIGAISGRIVADIPPARMAEWMALLGPALSRAEREAMAARGA